MSTIDRHLDEFKKVSPGAYQAMREVSRVLDQHGSILGRSKFVFEDEVNPDRSSSLRQISAVAPPPASFTVAPLDGKFIIAIANPQNVLPQSVAILQARAGASVNGLHAPILHNLQSATDLNFNAASGVTDYGFTSATAYTFQDPNVTKFWRLRSSYDGQNWNQWQIFSNPSTCGPAGVYSGMLRTAALTMVNNANTPTTQPLTQHAATTQIDVASSVCTFGSVTPNPTYNAGSVDPGVFGTYYIYALDPTRAGGTVTYIATLNVEDVTNNDAVVFFGKITTAGGGGGTGSGGGSGPCCIGEVEVEMMDGSWKAHKSLRVGDVIKAIDGGPETILKIELIANVPSFQFRAKNGLVLRGCSASHLLQYDGGGFEPSNMIIGGNRLDTKLGPSIVERAFIGNRTVYKLSLDRTRTYFADGFISHNQRVKP